MCESVRLFCICVFVCARVWRVRVSVCVRVRGCKAVRMCVRVSAQVRKCPCWGAPASASASAAAGGMPSSKLAGHRPQRMPSTRKERRRRRPIGSLQARREISWWLQAASNSWDDPRASHSGQPRLSCCSGPLGSQSVRA